MIQRQKLLKTVGDLMVFLITLSAKTCFSSIKISMAISLVMLSFALSSTCFAGTYFNVGDDFKLEKVSSEPAKELHVGDLVQTAGVTGTTRRGTVTELGTGASSALVKVHYDKPSSSDIMCDPSKEKLFLVSTTVIPITEPTPDSIKEVVQKYFRSENPLTFEIVKPAKRYKVTGGCFGSDYEVEGWTVTLSQRDPIVVFRNEEAVWCANEEPKPANGSSHRYKPKYSGDLELVK